MRSMLSRKTFTEAVVKTGKDEWLSIMIRGVTSGESTSILVLQGLVVAIGSARAERSYSMLTFFSYCNIVDTGSVQSSKYSKCQYTLPRLQRVNFIHLLCVTEHK